MCQPQSHFFLHSTINPSWSISDCDQCYLWVDLVTHICPKIFCGHCLRPITLITMQRWSLYGGFQGNHFKDWDQEKWSHYKGGLFNGSDLNWRLYCISILNAVATWTLCLKQMNVLYSITLLIMTSSCSCSNYRKWNNQQIFTILSCFCCPSLI